MPTLVYKDAELGLRGTRSTRTRDQSEDAGPGQSHGTRTLRDQDSAGPERGRGTRTPRDRDSAGPGLRGTRLRGTGTPRDQSEDAARGTRSTRTRHAGPGLRGTTGYTRRPTTLQRYV
uniref:Uncharacterized protein n=1 Tax=Knipowitschia caucasica TaxID=637954 RepID=A0AAV2KV29_KNICA